MRVHIYEHSAIQQYQDRFHIPTHWWRRSGVHKLCHTKAWQTKNKRKTLNFSSPGGARYASSTKLGMVIEVCTFLAPPKYVRLLCIVSPIGALNIWGNVHTPKFNPHTPKALDRICSNINTWPNMKLPTNDENLIKIAKGIRHCGVWRICQNAGKIFSLWAPHPHPCTDWGKIWRGGVNLRSPLHAKFNPKQCNVSAQRGKQTQNRFLITEIPALCAARNAASRYVNQYISGNWCLDVLVCVSLTQTYSSSVLPLLAVHYLLPMSLPPLPSWPPVSQLVWLVHVSSGKLFLSHLNTDMVHTSPRNASNDTHLSTSLNYIKI